MKIVETVAEMRAAAACAARPVGLVPTMGAVHKGHVALMDRARSENETIVTSLFVNPKQFGPSEDFDSYPRDFARDLAQFEACGTDIAFMPPVEQVYPPGFSTSIDVGPIAKRLEGASRPGHFMGVATVVCKLLATIRPDRVYLGQKDAQQCVVIRRLNADLNLGAEIVVVPTVRDTDGLALSSRNVYLSDDERTSALVLHRSLRLAERLWVDGVRGAGGIRASMRELIESEPGVRIDYVSIADSESLDELDFVEPPALVSVAARVGKTRLIDNTVLE